MSFVTGIIFSCPTWQQLLPFKFSVVKFCIVARHDTQLFFKPSFTRTLTFVFHLWPNICFPLVTKYLFSTCDQIFVSEQYKTRLGRRKRFCIFSRSEKPCVLDSDSKYYPQNKIFFALKSCEGLAALNTKWYPQSWWKGVKIPPPPGKKVCRRGGENTP